MINQLRGILFDRGIIIPKGRPRLDRWLRDELLSACTLTDRIRQLDTSINWLCQHERMVLNGLRTKYCLSDVSSL